jgi:hypothetical protein
LTLPVATRLTGWLDHAGMPVMWLRHADGNVRRDGFPAALLQRQSAVDERGRVHGAPGLADRGASRSGVAQGVVGKQKGSEDG